jgi:hypothetical protein
MEDPHFTPVNSFSDTDTKDGSAGDSLQSLEFRVIELDWIMLLRSIVIENFRILSDFQIL